MENKMRIMNVKVLVGDDKIAQQISMQGISESNIQDVLMMIGIFDNLRNLMHDKLKTLLDKSK